MKIISTIICDDVRREITGKDIIIGAYSGTIIVPTVPFELPLAVWIEMMPDDVGQHIVYVRLNYAGQELFTAQLGLNIHAPGGLALPVTGLFLRGDKVGDLSVDFSEDLGRDQTEVGHYGRGKISFAATDC